MASVESDIILFILHNLRIKRSIGRYFKRARNEQEISKAPNRKLRSLASIDKKVFMGRNAYTAIPFQKKSNIHVLYFHGGAYIYGLKNYHYNFISRIMDTIGCTVTIPDYPLAPHHMAEDAFTLAIESYKWTVEKSGADKIVLMGDSSGGGLALGLAQHLRDQQMPQPKHIILLSPWLDVTMQNPDMAAIDKLDPILSIEGLKMAGQAYAGFQDPKNPTISPMYGTFENLGAISLFTSTNDILNADARTFKRMSEKQGVGIRYEEYSGLFHDWMVFNIRESRDVIAKITEILGS